MAWWVELSSPIFIDPRVLRSSALTKESQSSSLSGQVQWTCLQLTPELVLRTLGLSALAQRAPPVVFSFGNRVFSVFLLKLGWDFILLYTHHFYILVLGSEEPLWTKSSKVQEPQVVITL